MVVRVNIRGNDCGRVDSIVLLTASIPKSNKENDVPRGTSDQSDESDQIGYPSLFLRDE